MGEKAFCCEGCRTVHDLLAANGLEQFYAMEAAPGIRVRERPGRDRWAFLDQPDVSRRLLNYSDADRAHVTFHVPAIHCVACVWLLENLFRLHRGIGQSQVDFARREVSIMFGPKLISLSQLVTLLASIGYEPELNLGELDKPSAPARRRQPWLQIGVAGFAFGNIMLLSLPQYFGMDSLSTPSLKPWFGGISLALALPVVLFSASDYWKAAWLALRRRVVTLDVPIALGLAAIYLQSVFEIALGRGEGYCDSLTGLIFFLLCGRAFQQRTQEWLTFDRDYRSFFPLSVCRRTSDAPDASQERVALDQLNVGDRIVVRNREIIPADATIVSGDALIDYSFVTGESQPVSKQGGEHVFAGGQQLGAAIELRTAKAVSQSYLTSLWNHEAFRKRRSEGLQNMTDRYSRRFTAIVIGVALGSAALWMLGGDTARGLKGFVSVLIVACPCALALAAPFTFGTAIRCLGRCGVFLKNSFVLERMAHIHTIVFDKTGTLTAPGAAMVRFEPVASGVALSDVEEACVQSLCRHSTHPHSASIAAWLDRDDALPPVSDFGEKAGRGVRGRAGAADITIGSIEWLRERGVNVPFDMAVTGPGATVHVAINKTYRGRFVLMNPLRSAMHELIRGLEPHYELALLSGDNEREHDRFRELFGPGAQLKFKQRPLDKLNFIERLQESGRRVMMVGDGLNDAGALQQSDVGVAVVEQAGVFSPASDAIIGAARVSDLGRVLAFARQATRIVRISFGISAVYNVAGVSIAAMGLLSPVVCAVLMPLSSVSVVAFACGMTIWAARRSGFTIEKVEDGHRPSALLTYQPA